MSRAVAQLAREIAVDLNKLPARRAVMKPA
jgi:hypothetical protein